MKFIKVHTSESDTHGMLINVKYITTLLTFSYIDSPNYGWTYLTLSNGVEYLVRESKEKIIEMIQEAMMRSDVFI